ncbi:hypothetical protein SD37_40290 [Amycolatopsis orientalis]|uniref:Methionyl-tRNA formyltransferase n=1 Tax=Amycolatopsis orientalis TaxID=31958 RepID=A0A193C9D0_AMYOR|nr:hypothetical protein SD37_40290 [Amycolatopsis orientalis]
MAIVTEFFQVRGEAKPHPTQVECGYKTVSTPAGPLLQLSTYGSDGRQSEKKVSQTLQLDREGARRLLSIIRDTFPDL